jgi:uncharacterized iron-regulated protein
MRRSKIKDMKILIFIVLMLTIFPASTVQAEELNPVYNLSVSFDIEKNLLKGTSLITFSEDKMVDISAGNLKILSITFNGHTLEPQSKDKLLTISSRGILEIVFEGIFTDDNEPENPENAGVVTKNIISDRGIFLTDKWYPSIEGMAVYHLKAFLPEGYAAISESDEVLRSRKETGTEYVFNFAHPISRINLIAGKYREVKENFQGIDIYGYFFPENISLAKTYLEYLKKYLKTYADLLISYPYKRFSVIENILPAGYSMPTFTLLGQDAVRLPFFEETFLSHEILHQWFGNLVYADYKTGNWSEGLTAYLSGHLYEEQKGKGWQYRKNIMVDYENYVLPEKEFPLKDFIIRNDHTSGAIGYGKGAMLFHMLKDLTGDDAFYRALKGFLKEKEFQEASWDDLITAFEKTSDKNLGWFFSQWLERKGIPSLEIREPRVIMLKGIHTVVFDIVQNGETYIMNLPVKIKTDKAEIHEKIKLEKGRETFEIPVQGEPLEMIIDSTYDIMRKLSKDEYPPVISRLLGDDKKLIIVPEEEKVYTGLIDVFRQQGFESRDEDEIQDEDIKANSLLVFGSDSPIMKRLFGGVQKTDSGFTLTVRKNPLNTTKVIGIAQGDSEEADLAAKKIFQYGQYSFLRFEGGENMDKQTEETESGMKIILSEPVLVIQPQKTLKLDDIIKTVLDKPIIYIAERHTDYEDHKVQLKVIRSLYEKGRKFAIGMEMFQRPFQKIINDYLSGSISEKEFLKKTQYFKRWQFDYNLYREIIEYARTNNIPVVALNLWTEIVKKVSAEGLDALTDIERAQIPEDMDMSDEVYRERLKDVFKKHRNREIKDFDNFYQSQILWDETMAHSIDEFLRENPGYQMVVLAGTGHIMYDSGIPKRTYRLNGKEFVTIIPAAESLDENIGDFLYSSGYIPPPTTLKLGVILKEKNGWVEIDRIVPGSVAKSVGLEKGDILLSFDDWKIEDIADVNIFMFDKKRGENITVKVLRKRFLFGYKELVLTGTI